MSAPRDHRVEDRYLCRRRFTDSQQWQVRKPWRGEGETLPALPLMPLRCNRRPSDLTLAGVRMRTRHIASQISPTRFELSKYAISEAGCLFCLFWSWCGEWIVVSSVSFPPRPVEGLRLIACQVETPPTPKIS